VDINDPAIKKQLDLAGNIQDILRQFSVTQSEVTASYLGLESGLFIVVDSSASTSLARDFDPRTRSWYQSAVQKRPSCWSDLFEDISGRGLSISCGLPVYTPDQKLVGVAASGAVLTEIEDIIGSASLGESGYAFLLSSEGQIILSPVKADFTQKDGEPKTGLNYSTDIDNNLQLLAQKMTAKESGVYQMTLRGRDVCIAYAPLSVADWSIGLVEPTAEIIEPVSEMENGILALNVTSAAKISDSISITLTIFLIVIIAAVVIAAFMAFLFASGITNPITNLNSAVIRIAGGDLDTEISVNTHDEIAELGRSVNKMTRDIKDYIQNLSAVTAEKERISAELEIAAHIQSNMLPNIFPPYPDRPEIDLYGLMRPAKEVGGDFYDFFFLDHDRLALVVADVSGKGVPSALFMVIAKTLIKNNAQSGLSPAEVFEKVNTTLCWNNKADLFVTAFLAYFSLKTGELTFVNAGHNPPFVCHTDGAETLKVTPGFVLGGLEGIKFSEGQTKLQTGEVLFLYTDGLTEASNIDGQMFGKDRVIKALDDDQAQNVQSLVMTLKNDVDSFVGKAEQFDDMTMLALIFNTKSPAAL
jgi:sigma-B regulation protein RsbU (phosphoserine phosphatase)